jgi:opacity protein-like surface antigen
MITEDNVMKLRNLVLGAALSLPLLALADGNPFAGAYAGLGLGHTSTDAKVTSSVENVEFGNGNFAGQVVGGYNYAIDSNWLVGAEAFFAANAGKSTGNILGQTFTAKMNQTYGADAILGYAFNPTAMIYGGAGWGFSKLKLSGDVNNNTSYNGWRAVAGAQQALTDAFSIRESVDYTAFKSKTMTVDGLGLTAKPNQFTSMLSFIYTFNM